MTKEDKAEIIAACSKTDRTFLYVMVFIVLMHSCNAPSRSDIQRIETKIEKLTK